MAAGTIGAQGASQGRALAGVVQTHQTATGRHDRTRGGDAKAGYDHLAHAEQTENLRGVSRTRGRMRKDGFGALVPIPNGRGRHRAAPFGLGPWDGAQVASQDKGIVLASRGWRIGQNREEIEETKGRSGCSIRVASW